MNRVTAATTASAVHGGRAGRLGGRYIVLAVVAMVIVVDQATKWWAWRHVPWTIINYGGDMLVGPRIGDWYADPVSGALLDFVDVGLLGLAVFALVRRPRPTAVLVAGAL